MTRQNQRSTSSPGGISSPGSTSTSRISRMDYVYFVYEEAR
ncbi:hypothetical protein [Streptomyces sp. CB01635]|nr:hypothetical protein [Streptomyces sp. CB01635]